MRNRMKKQKLKLNFKKQNKKQKSYKINIPTANFFSKSIHSSFFATKNWNHFTIKKKISFHILYIYIYILVIVFEVVV